MLTFSSFVIGQTLASQPVDLYMDTLINTALQRVIREEKLDPTHLPSFSLDTNGYEKANFTEGSLKGFSYVKRVNECSEPQNISGSTVIYCALTFPYLEANYKGKLKNDSVPIAFDAIGDYQDVYFEIQIVQLPNFNRHKFVKTFFPRTSESANVDFKGLESLDSEFLKKFFKIFVEQDVIRVIKTRFQCALNLAVNSIPLPPIKKDVK